MLGTLGQILNSRVWPGAHGGKKTFKLENVQKTAVKGTVQQKLTGVLSGINRKLMICHCSDGYSFF
jgi:hypothetical protein